jgi:hypothetical protein
MHQATSSLARKKGFICLAALAAAAEGCGGGSSAPVTSTAAAVTGPADMHCEMNDMEIRQAIGMCVMDTGDAAAPAPTSDGGSAEGAADGGATGSGDYGATMYGFQGSDDDCKYDVSWTSTDVKENVGVTFYVKAVRRIDGQPATGANVQVEVFLNSTHPTPTINIPNQESPGGNYAVGPFVFDQSGIWTVRFHFFEMCSDAPPDSPHGHAAFFINVP